MSQISPQRHATLPTHQTVPSTTPYYKVLKSATPVLFCTTKYYSSTPLYYKVLLQKVLLQYYSVLQSTTPESTTPVLLRTTKYYSSTTPYYSSTTMSRATSRCRSSPTCMSSPTMTIFAQPHIQGILHTVCDEVFRELPASTMICRRSFNLESCMWNDVWNDVKTTSSREEQTLFGDNAATCGSATTGTNMLHIQDTSKHAQHSAVCWADAGLFFLHFQICWAASWSVQGHHHGRAQTMSGLEDRLSCMWNDVWNDVKTTSRRRDFSTWQ